MLNACASFVTNIGHILRQESLKKIALTCTAVVYNIDNLQTIMYNNIVCYTILNGF